MNQYESLKSIGCPLQKLCQKHKTDGSCETLYSKRQFKWKKKDWIKEMQDCYVPIKYCAICKWFGGTDLYFNAPCYKCDDYQFFEKNQTTDA